MLQKIVYEKISGFSDETSKLIDEQFEVLNKLHIKYFEVREMISRMDGNSFSQNLTKK